MNQRVKRQILIAGGIIVGFIVVMVLLGQMTS